MSAPFPDGGASATAERGPQRALVFTIGGRELAVSIESVVEVVRHRGATHVPGAPEGVEGIVPVRGRMVTLIDLRHALRLPPRPPGTRLQVIVVESAGDRFGLLVDAVTRVAVPPPDTTLVDLNTLTQGPS
jgi:purine-binding chemotaxis protein CheW